MTKEIKSISPLHANRPITSNVPNNTYNQFGFYRPPTQINQSSNMNKSFNNMQVKGGMPGVQNFQIQFEVPSSNMSINYVNPNKTNLGFGRFS
jgi:hypothetical protein